jgi:hypothetical protein
MVAVFRLVVVAAMAGCGWKSGVALAPTGDAANIDAPDAAIDAHPDAVPDARPDAPPDAPPIPIVYVQSKQVLGGGSVVAAAFPAAQTAGNFNIVAVSWYTPTAIPAAPTDTAGNTYLLAQQATDGTITHQIYYATSIATSASNTVTVTWSASATYPELRVLEYSGITTESPIIDVIAFGSGTSAFMDSGPGITTTRHDLLIGVGTAAASGAGTGWTQRILGSGDLVEDQEVMAIGTYNATGPTSTDEWAMSLVAFRGAN